MLLLSYLLEDFGLEVRGQLGVNGQHSQGRCILQLLQMLHNLVGGDLRTGEPQDQGAQHSLQAPTAPPSQDPGTYLDVLLARHEDKDVPRGPGQVYLQGLLHGGLHVILLWGLHQQSAVSRTHGNLGRTSPQAPRGPGSGLGSVALSP